MLSRAEEKFSELAQREVEEQEIDFARLAAHYRGMFKGAPDLSSREGYGDKKQR
jgi:hypothetical protein